MVLLVYNGESCDSARNSCIFATAVPAEILQHEPEVHGRCQIRENFDSERQSILPISMVRNRILEQRKSAYSFLASKK